MRREEQNIKSNYKAYTQHHQINEEPFDNSREIIISEDMRRNLNDVMEENDEDYNYGNPQKPPMKGHRGSFGQPDLNESERLDVRSTPKMGIIETKHSEENENFDLKVKKNENINLYNDQSSKIEDFDNEIGLNLSKVDLQNKKFSDLVIDGKLNREVLKDRIIKNQSLFDEYSESYQNQLIEKTTNNQNITKEDKFEESFEETTQNYEDGKKKMEPKVMYSKDLADQFIFNKRDNNRRNNRVNSSWVISTKSHTDLGLKLWDKSSVWDISNLQTVFELLIDKFTALETDIARNLK